MPGTLEVHLVTPQREVWSGQADMVIARGTEGEVGILAGHAPMLIRLDIGWLRIKHDGSEEKAVVDGGFMHVTTGQGVTRVDVIADGAELAHEIDVRAAEHRAQELERRLEHKDDAGIRSELSKAMARASLRR
ncbi:MAG: ATP synthase F1 subunit epsilon [Actinomycetota bacterium]